MGTRSNSSTAPSYVVELLVWSRSGSPNAPVPAAGSVWLSVLLGPKANAISPVHSIRPCAKPTLQAEPLKLPIWMLEKPAGMPLKVMLLTVTPPPSSTFSTRYWTVTVLFTDNCACTTAVGPAAARRRINRVWRMVVRMAASFEALGHLMLEVCRPFFGQTYLVRSSAAIPHSGGMPNIMAADPRPGATDTSRYTEIRKRRWVRSDSAIRRDLQRGCRRTLAPDRKYHYTLIE